MLVRLHPVISLEEGEENPSASRAPISVGKKRRGDFPLLGKSHRDGEKRSFSTGVEKGSERNTYSSTIAYSNFEGEKWSKKNALESIFGLKGGFSSEIGDPTPSALKGRVRKKNSALSLGAGGSGISEECSRLRVIVGTRGTCQKKKALSGFFVSQ